MGPPFESGPPERRDALFVRTARDQPNGLAEALGCELTPEGTIAVDRDSRTGVRGAFAAGNAATEHARSVAHAIGLGSRVATRSRSTWCSPGPLEAHTRTYLALDDSRALRPAARPSLDGLEIARVEPADGAMSRWFYVRVGERHNWTDHLHRSESEWQTWADGVETWVATVAGERAGYYELRLDGESVELAYFGLLAEFHGQGLGGYLLTHALRRALELAPRVWLHTNTQDAPVALPNYLARGLRPFRTEAISG